MRPEIVIADNNHKMRERMANALADREYAISTTGSAALLMHHLLHGKRPVVILGDGLEEGLTVSNLLSLLKSCVPTLLVILITGDLSFPEEVKVRQQEIFYRMHRPESAACWGELYQAVECACKGATLAVSGQPH